MPVKLKQKLKRLNPNPKLDIFKPRLPFLVEFDMYDTVRHLLDSKIHPGFIPAIKYVRTVTNWGLFDSKVYVEKIRDGWTP